MTGKLDKNEIRDAVRERYAKAAASAKSCCGTAPSPCCGAPDEASAAKISLALGYSSEELKAVPEGANLGLGCGNPQAIASLKPGETVLDLGSGAGFDAFLAARAVGEKGRVIGVDMTPEMLAKARQNSAKAGVRNVDFRLGELEALPVQDGIVDVIISNCVVNLSPEKEKVFGEAFRVLKPGGRLAISDIVKIAELPEAIKNDMALYFGCVAGAASVREIEFMLRKVGFERVSVKTKDESRVFIRQWLPESGVENYVASATIEALKPGA